MTLTTHALVGAAAASLFPSEPYLAFAAGFVSHLAIDAIPHWDYHGWLHSVRRDPLHPLQNEVLSGKGAWRDFAIIAADALLGFVLTFGVARFLNIPAHVALIGAGAGVYPDILQFVYYKIRHDDWLRPVLEPLQKFHISLQREIYPRWYIGLGYQLALVAVVLLVLWLL